MDQFPGVTVLRSPSASLAAHWLSRDNLTAPHASPLERRRPQRLARALSDAARTARAERMRRAFDVELAQAAARSRC